MNEKLVNTKMEIQKREVKRLEEIEMELAEMIADTENEALMEKYIDWVNQRSRCNDSYFALIDSFLNP